VIEEKRAKVTGMGAVEHIQMTSALDKCSRIDGTGDYFLLNTPD
jgi:hypothetical protein